MMFWDWILFCLACVIYISIGMAWSFNLDEDYARHRRTFTPQGCWRVILFWPVAGFYYQHKINKHKRVFF